METSEKSRPSQASRLYSARVAGMVPHPVHWNRPPQSPVAQWPVPLALNTHPVRPQNLLFQWSGTVIDTLCPAGRTHPVAAIGCLASGAAATQIGWLGLVTKVTRGAPPDVVEPAGADPADVDGDWAGEAEAGAWWAGVAGEREERAVAGIVAVTG